MAIRSDNDPSRVAPHSGIDNGDLEEYGVWVKAEPRDILAENGESVPEDIDFDLPVESSALSEDTFLSEDEERLLGTFDADFDGPSPSLESDGDLGPLPDIEEVSSETPSDDIEPLDISLEDIESLRSPNTIGAGSDLDISTVQGLDAESVPERPSADQGFDAMEDVSAQFLDEADISASPAPREEPSSSNFGLDDVTSQFLSDAEEAVPLSRPIEAAQEFEPLDIDLSFDGESAPASGSRAESALEPISEFDDFIAPGSGSVEGFDDLAAVEASLSEPSSKSPASGVSPAPDLSSELLLKIADELSSIRGELVALKAQISGMSVSSEPAPKAEAVSDKSSAGGFFDEEEDETIALTGDELDNILNTADFTEEASSLDLEASKEEAPPAADDSAESSFEGIDLVEEAPSEEFSESLVEEEPLLPESGVYGSERPIAPAIEELRLGEADSVDEIEEVPPEDSLSELVNVSEEGVRAMTPPPEDSSYLESEGISLDEGLALDGAPLEDVPLVEPDLSEFELETEEAVSGLEISEELPLVAESPDIKLDIDAGPGYDLDYQADEAEFLEPVPEAEDSVYGEINLHEESKVGSVQAPASDSASDEVSDVEEVEELEELDEEDSSLQDSISVRPDEVPVSIDEGLVMDESPLPSAEVEELPEVEEIEEPVVSVAEASLEADVEVGQSSAASSLETAPSAEDDRLKSEIRSVLTYLDKLLDSLPEDKIEEFARSEYFDTYKRLFEELGLV